MSLILILTAFIAMNMVTKQQVAEDTAKQIKAAQERTIEVKK